MDVNAKVGLLLQAIITNRSECKILRLIDRKPMAAQFRFANGRYPLHVACRHRCDDEGSVIMKLLEVFPQAATFPDEDGWYPLHIAINRVFTLPKDVIVKLIEIHPEACATKMPDANGSYPLHVACRHIRRDDEDNVVIMKLLEVFPQATQLQDAKGWYPLHIACRRRQNDDLILKLIEIYPKAATKAVLYDYSCQLYPLHLLASYYNENVVRTLAHIYPAALHHKMLDDNYPIHHAFTLVIMKCFINLDPSVIHQTDPFGYTILHQACISENMVDQVEYLLELPDIDVNATNTWGHSVLHSAINYESFNIVDVLLRHPFIMIDQRNHDDETPFDLVDKEISRLQNLDNADDEKHLLPKYQQIKKQLENHLRMTRWGSYEYFYQNVEDWSMNQ